MSRRMAAHSFAGSAFGAELRRRRVGAAARRRRLQIALRSAAGCCHPPGGPANDATRGAAAGSASSRSTRGWLAGPGVTGLRVEGGHLAGRSSSPAPMLVVERGAAGLREPDMLTAVEVRLRTSLSGRVFEMQPPLHLTGL
jgi:hypothetical protein